MPVLEPRPDRPPARPSNGSGLPRHDRGGAGNEVAFEVKLQICLPSLTCRSARPVARRSGSKLIAGPVHGARASTERRDREAAGAAGRAVLPRPRARRTSAGTGTVSRSARFRARRPPPADAEALEDSRRLPSAAACSPRQVLRRRCGSSAARRRRRPPLGHARDVRCEVLRHAEDRPQGQAPDRLPEGARRDHGAARPLHTDVRRHVPLGEPRRGALSSNTVRVVIPAKPKQSRKARAVRVLAVTHGPSVGPGVFADAVEDAGHELVEWPVPLGGRAPDGADARDRLRRRDAPRRGGAHGWLTPGAAVARRAARARHAPARRLPRLAARSPVRRAPRSSARRVRGRLASGRADRGCGRGSRRAALPERFDAFQWHHYTHDPPGRSRRAGAQRASARRPSGSDSAWGVQFHPEVRAGAGRGVARRGPGRRRGPAGFAAATRERIEDWNALGRGLCTAFLAARLAGLRRQRLVPRPLVPGAAVVRGAVTRARRISARARSASRSGSR